MAPQQVRGERAGEAGRAGDDHPRRALARGAAQGRPSHAAHPRARRARATIRSRTRRDVLVGERALERAEGQRERERAPALPHLLAACRRRTRSTLVEHLAGRRRARARAPRPADDRSGSVTARSWRSGGNGAERAEGDHRRGAGRGELAEVDRERRRALAGPTRAATSGCSSPTKPSCDRRCPPVARTRSRRRCGRGAGTATRAGSHRPVARGSGRAARRAAPWRRRSRPRARSPRQERGARPPLSSTPSAWCSSASGPRLPSPSRGTRCRTRRSRRRGPLRETLWRAASSSEPSSVGRMIDCASDSGFSSATTRRMSWSARQPQAVEQAGLGEAPADDLVQAARRRARPRRRGAPAGRGVSLPAAPRRAGSVAGSRSRPSMRATSSIRSTSRVTSSRRSAGTRHLEAVRRAARLRSRARSGSRAWRSHARPARRGSPARAPRAARIAGGGPAALAADVDRAGRDASRRTARSSGAVAIAWACMHCSGCSPFSKRAGGLAAQPERPRACGGCSGRSRWRPRAARAWCPAATSERAPPISPAIDVGPVGVLDHDHLSIERARLPVERLHAARRRARGAPSAARRRRGRGRTRAAAARSAASRSW